MRLYLCALVSILSLSKIALGVATFLHKPTDILAIQNTLALYPIYLDTKEFTSFASIFTPDVYANYSGPYPWIGLPELQGNLSSFLVNVTTQHSLTTQYIQMLEQGKANVTTYLIAQHFGSGAYEGEMATAYGKYEDTLKLTSDRVWKVSTRTYIPMVRRLSKSQ